MFRFLVNVSPTAFAFLSGLMVSVATSAISQVVFAEKVALNRDQVIAGGVVAFAAGILWFVLSETTAGLMRKVDAMTPVLNSREAAISGISRREKAIVLWTFVLAIAASGTWPWAGSLMPKRTESFADAPVVGASNRDSAPSTVAAVPSAVSRQQLVSPLRERPKTD